MGIRQMSYAQTHLLASENLHYLSYTKGMPNVYCPDQQST